MLGNIRKGLLYIISAPSGAGKSTLVQMLLKEFPDAIAQSCSSTTRPIRVGEKDREDYIFMSSAAFQKKIDEKAFLEHAKVFGYDYGTEREIVEHLLQQGKHVVLVIDTQGAIQIMQERTSAISIFIFPPSLEELRSRLYKRRTESEEKIQERLLWAKQELTLASCYDYQVVNDDLKITYQILRSIFIAEEHKRR